MAMVMENQQPLPLAPMPAVPPPAQLPPPPPPLPPPPQAYFYKHRCKVCNKGFMCGRALGGHMRAHGVTDDGLSADDDALDDDDGDGDGDSGPCGGAWDSSEAAGGTAAAAAAATKRMSYSLRTNAGRHKNCRGCENCGKEFTSWKSLLDHGRCAHDKEKDGLSSVAGAGADEVDGEDEEDLALAAGVWSKGKRTRRTKVIVEDNHGSQVDEPLPATSSREEEDLAKCLVMLASSRRGAQPPAIVDVVHQQPYASTSKQDERAPASRDEQGFLVPPAPISAMLPPHFKFLAPPEVMTPPSPVVPPRGLFECKACKKVFTSHQALGGHRASHKKVKGCFAAKLEMSSRNDSPQPSTATANADDNIKQVVVEAIPAAAAAATTVDTTEPNGVVVDGNAEAGMLVNGRTAAVVAGTSSAAAPEMAIMQQQVVDEAPSSSTASPLKRKGKVHECSICHRVFMSGQALGGHKRCHWLTTGAAGDPTAVAKLPFAPQDHDLYQRFVLGAIGTLDLNVPMDQFEDADATGQAGELNESMASLIAPAASLYMHPWAGPTNAGNMHNTMATNGHYHLLPEGAATEDEADSTSAKRAKMSDLKDMNMSGETSPWLQVGIALPASSSETVNNDDRLHKPEG